MNWTIDSGWFILTIVSFVLGTPLTVMKIIDMIRNWRKENKVAKQKQPIIIFRDVKARASTLDSQFSKFKVTFNAKNNGGSDTLVYIIEYSIKVTNDIETWNYSEKIDNPDRFDLPVLGQTENHIIVNLPKDAKDWIKGTISFTYQYTDIEGLSQEMTTRNLDIRRKDI